MTAVPRARFLRVDPRPRIAVDCLGVGPVVVFLHGIGGNRHSWIDQLPVVGAEFTAIAWDARGYGDSDDYEGPLHFTDFADDLCRVLDYFAVDRAHVVGTSMGGRIALDFNARYGARVATLTLADTSAGSAKVASAEEVEKFLALRKKPLLEGKTPRDIAPQIAASLVGPGTGPQVMARLLESIGTLHTDSYVKTLDTVTRHTAFAPFADIHVPSLLIVGEHDRIATPDYMADMAARIAGAKFVMIPGASHIANMDRAAEFNAALLPFLRQHRALADSPATAIISEQA